jgi:bacitracin transport system ATP-binding protein
MIKVRNLVKKYNKDTVLNRVNITVPKNKIYGFLGRNGAGKTTTLKAILGLIAYHQGTISIDDKTVTKTNNIALGNVGSLIEYPGFYPNLSGIENLKIFGTLLNKPFCVEKALDTVGLLKDKNKRVGFYSLGMKQRLGIARALLSEPDVLILDEPTNGLDPSGIRNIRQLLKNLSVEHGKTILLSSHILSEVEQMVDIIGIIKDGTMVAEEPIAQTRKRCIKNGYIKTSDNNRAINIMESMFKVKATIANEYIVVCDDINMGMINKYLVENGIIVSELSKKSQNLEEFFLKVIE